MQNIEFGLVVTLNIGWITFKSFCNTSSKWELSYFITAPNQTFCRWFQQLFSKTCMSYSDTFFKTELLDYFTQQSSCLACGIASISWYHANFCKFSQRQLVWFRYHINHHGNEGIIMQVLFSILLTSFFLLWTYGQWILSGTLQSCSLLGCQTTVLSSCSLCWSEFQQ